MGMAPSFCVAEIEPTDRPVSHLHSEIGPTDAPSPDFYRSILYCTYFHLKQICGTRGHRLPMTVWMNAFMAMNTAYLEAPAGAVECRRYMSFARAVLFRPGSGARKGNMRLAGL